MYILARLVLNALALMLIAVVVPGVMISSFPLALLAALVIALVNALVRPLLELISLPITILTLGLFSLIITALMFWLASAISPGFSVDGFVPAFWGGLIFWAISWALSVVISKKK